MVNRFKLSNAFEEILQLMQEQQVSLHELDAILIRPEAGSQVIPLFSALSTYFSFVEESEEAALVLDEDGTIFYVNKAFCQWTDTHYNDLLRSTFFTFLEEDTAHTIQNFLKDSSKMHFRKESSLKISQDNTKTVFLSLHKIKIDKKFYCTVLITDLSAQRTLEYLTRHNELLTAVLKHSEDFLIITDADGKIIETSQNFKDLIRSDVADKFIWNLVEIHDFYSGEQIEVKKLISKKEKFHKKKCRLTWMTKIEMIAYLTISPLNNSSGDNLGCLFSIADITETQKTLDFNEAILNAMLDAYILADDKGKILDVNPSYCRLTGYTKDELLNMTIFDMEAMLTPEQINEKIQEMIREGSARFVTRHKRKLGGEVVFDVSITVAQEGERHLVAAFCKDITEKEALERILKESESRYRGLFQGSPIPIAVIRDEKIWLINEAGMKVLGESNPVRYSFRTIWDFIHPDFHHIARERIKLLLSGKKEVLPPQTYKMIRFDGSTFEAEIVSSRVLFKGKPAIQIVFTDISEREKLEKIRELLSIISTGIYSFMSINDIGKLIEDYLKTIIPFESLILATYKKSGKMRIEYATRDEGFEEYELEGTLSDEVLKQKKIISLTKKDFEKRLKSGQTLKGLEPKSWIGIPLFDQNQILGILILQNFEKEYACSEEDEKLLRLISEQLSIALREKLRFDELQQFKYIIDNNPVSVIITDPEGNIEYVNEFFTKISGYNEDEVIGKNPRLLKSGKTPAETYQQLWETITRGETWVGEFINKRKDGTLFYERAIISPIKDEKGRILHFIGLKEDITEKKQLEDQLIQTQKMEALGQLVGGVAHDFNNLLTAINGYAEYCLVKIDSKHPLYKAISTIHNAGKSAAELTNQLLAFSRKQQYNPQKVNVQDSISSWKKIFRRLIPEDIHLEFSIEKKVSPIYADPLQLEQVLLNLIVNARDAIKENENDTKRQITVEADEVFVDEKLAEKYPNLKPGRYVVLSVSDTGIGIPENIRNRIFEPFFTTKERGRGTGLGLSTIFGIVTQNNGDISFYSEVGKGTTFKVYWPVLTGEVAEPEKKEQKVTIKKRLKIVVIEDDNNVRGLIESILEEHQMEIYSFDSAEKALDFIEKSPTDLDLIISDIVMPGMSGLELMNKLKKKNPNIRIILMSGYSDQHMKTTNGLFGEYTYLQKPFSSITLLEKINEALGTTNHE